MNTAFLYNLYQIVNIFKKKYSTFRAILAKSDV